MVFFSYFEISNFILNFAYPAIEPGLNKDHEDTEDYFDIYSHDMYDGFGFCGSAVQWAGT